MVKSNVIPNQLADTWACGARLPAPRPPRWQGEGLPGAAQRLGVLFCIIFSVLSGQCEVAGISVPDGVGWGRGAGRRCGWAGGAQGGANSAVLAGVSRSRAAADGCGDCAQLEALVLLWWCKQLFRLREKQNVGKAFCFQRLINCSCKVPLRGILSNLLSCGVFSWLRFTNVSKNASLLGVNVLRRSVIEIPFPVLGR